jgi:hypothetical protein
MKLKVIAVATLLVAPFGWRAGCQPSEPQASPLSLPKHNDMGGKCPGTAKITIGYPENPQDAQKGAAIFLEVPKVSKPIQADRPFDKYDKKVTIFRKAFDLSAVPPESCGAGARLYYIKDNKPSQAVDVVLPPRSDNPSKNTKLIVLPDPPQIDCGKQTDVTITVTNGNIESLGELHIGNWAADPASVSDTSAQVKGVMPPCNGPKTLPITAKQGDKIVTLNKLTITNPGPSAQVQIEALQTAIGKLTARINEVQGKMRREVGKGIIITLILTLFIVGSAQWWYHHKKFQPAIAGMREEFINRLSDINNRFMMFKDKVEKWMATIPTLTTPPDLDLNTKPKDEPPVVPPPGDEVQHIRAGAPYTSLEMTTDARSSGFSCDRLVRDYNHALDDASRHGKFVADYGAQRIKMKNQLEVTRSSIQPVFSEDERGDLYAIPYNHINYLVPALDRVWTGDTVRIWDYSFKIQESSVRRLKLPAEATQQAGEWSITKKGELERVP